MCLLRTNFFLIVDNYCCSGEKISDEMEALVGLMRQFCTDSARSSQLRTQCARSLALCSFLSLEQPSSVLTSAAALRSIWIGTKSSTVSPVLFCAALAGWSLLVQQVSIGKSVKSKIESCLKKSTENMKFYFPGLEKCIALGF